MRSSRSILARWAGLGSAVLAVALLLIGCSVDPEEKFRTEAVAAIRAAAGRAEKIAGFKIVAGLDAELSEGDPPALRRVYPEPKLVGVQQTGAPLSLNANLFPLDDQLEYALRLLESCDGSFSLVEATALSDTAVITTSTCTRDGIEARSVLLNGKELGPINDGLSAAGVSALWKDLEAAGITGDIYDISIDLPDDDMTVIYSVPGREPKYGWSRGLEESKSVEMSHGPQREEPRISLADYPAAEVAAQLELLLSKVPAGQSAARMMLSWDQSASSARLKVTAEDYTELGSTLLGG